MEQKILYGTKVTLRPITMDDTYLIVKWRNNPTVKENFIFREEFTPEIHQHWMKTKVASGDVVQYIIEDSKTSLPVGSVYFQHLDKKNNSAEYGIFIGEDSARGKGLGTEAAQLFIQYGLNDLKLHRISLRVLAGNEAAYKSYLKVGFKHEGTFRDMVKLDGQYRDVIFMSILESDNPKDVTE